MHPLGPLPPHHQFRDFLDAQERERLIEYVIGSRDRFVPALLQGHVLDRNRRIAERLNDLGPLRSVFEERLTGLLADIFQNTGAKPFEVEYFELEVAAHGDGAFFANHSDIPVGAGRKPLGGDESGKQDRLVSAVYYFYRKPKRFSGGTLRIHRLADRAGIGDFVEVEPLQNSLLVFPSWARHEVTRVACPGCAFEDYRFAVNAWLCRKLAPGDPK